MHFFRYSWLIVPLLTIFVNENSHAQRKLASDGLQHFFELGLRDTRSAQWVNFREANEYSESAGFPSGGNGNAWLQLPQAGKAGWVLLDQARPLALPADFELPSQTEEWDAEAVDLKQELPNYEEGFRQNDERWKGESLEDDYDLAQRKRCTGQALLFLAHLKRRGENDFVEKWLPHVMDWMPEASQAVDCAVTELANAEAAVLRDIWYKKRDSAAYRAGLNALMAKYDRGWEDREGAALLIKRLAEPPTAAENAFVKWLLTSREIDLTSVYQRSWIFPSPDGPLEQAEPPFWKGHADSAIDCAQKLSKLLNDPRFCLAQFTSLESSAEPSRERTAQQQFEEMPRPKMLEELAAALLQPILPSGKNELQSAAQKKEAAVWISKLDGNYDAIAWQMMSNANGGYDNGFRTGLAFLVRQGNDESLSKLPSVFQDPETWSNTESTAKLLKQYLEKRPDPTMEEKAIGIIRKKYEKAYGALDPPTKEYLQSQLRRIERILRPTDIGEDLKQISLLQDAEEISSQLFEILQTSPAAAARIFQFAATVQKPEFKLVFLNVLPTPPDLLAVENREALRLLLKHEELYAKLSEMAVLTLPATEQLQAKKAFNNDLFALRDWSLTLARSIAAGEPKPALPIADKIPKEELDRWIEKLARLSPGELTKAIEQEPLGRKLALFDAVKQQPETLPNFAALSIVIQVSKDARISAEGMPVSMGKIFDQKLLEESIQWLQQQTGGGYSMALMLGNDPWGINASIIVLRAVTPETVLQTFDPNAISLPGQPHATGVLFVHFVSEQDQKGIAIAWPFWNKPELDQAWLKQRAATDSPSPIMQGAPIPMLEKREDFYRKFFEFWKGSGKGKMLRLMVYSLPSESEPAVPEKNSVESKLEAKPEPAEAATP